jgi:hypothetical protein
LVGGAIQPSLLGGSPAQHAFHPAAKVSTPMDGGIPVCPVKELSNSQDIILAIIAIATISFQLNYLLHYLLQSTARSESLQNKIFW